MWIWGKYVHMMIYYLGLFDRKTYTRIVLMFYALRTYKVSECTSVIILASDTDIF